MINCLTIVRKYLLVGLFVKKRDCWNGFKGLKKKKCLRINYNLKTKKPIGRYLGAIVCVNLSIASIFGYQWIEKHEEGLQVKGSNIPLSGVLREWCDVCQKQCVVDIDPKQKITLSVEKKSCEDVYAFLSQSVSVDQHKDVYWFSSSPKGSWVSYLCEHRQPSDIKAALKSLLSPLGKYEHVVEDNATSTLWLPKRFYQNNHELVKSMDSLVSQYTIILSWVLISNDHKRSYKLEDDLVCKWFKGTIPSIDYLAWLKWISRQQDRGEIKLLSQMNLPIRSGELVRVKLSELLSVPRRDKKGTFFFKDVTQDLLAEIKTTMLKDNMVQMQIKLLDENETPNHQTNIMLENTVMLGLDQSMILTSIHKNKTSKQRECKSTLSQLPILGRLFCHYRNNDEKEKYILVVTLV